MILTIFLITWAICYVFCLYMNWWHKDDEFWSTKFLDKLSNSF